MCTAGLPFSGCCTAVAVVVYGSMGPVARAVGINEGSVGTSGPQARRCNAPAELPSLCCILHALLRLLVDACVGISENALGHSIRADW